MEIRFAGRMDGFRLGIFNVLDERKNERLAEGKRFITCPSVRRTFCQSPILWRR